MPSIGRRRTLKRLNGRTLMFLRTVPGEILSLFLSTRDIESLCIANKLLRQRYLRWNQVQHHPTKFLGWSLLPLPDTLRVRHSIRFLLLRDFDLNLLRQCMPNLTDLAVHIRRYDILNLTFPPSLLKLKIEAWGFLNIVGWPARLKSLTLSLYQCPNNLDQKNSFLTQLPSSLTHLGLKSFFELEIELPPNFVSLLPTNITSIALRSHSLPPTHFPERFTHISLLWAKSTNFLFPDRMEKLILDQALTCVPKYCRHFEIRDDFTSFPHPLPLECNVLKLHTIPDHFEFCAPKNLHTLDLRVLETINGKWPSTLKILTVRCFYDDNLKRGDLPPNLEELDLGGFNGVLRDGHNNTLLPKTLKLLKLPDWNRRLTDADLPPQLEKLFLPAFRGAPVPREYFPRTLNEIQLGTRMYFQNFYSYSHLYSHSDVYDCSDVASYFDYNKEDE